MSVAVEICNDALNHLGAEAINDLADDNNIARTCNRQYPIARDYILRQLAWNFAIQRDEITSSGTSTIFGETDTFIIPSNCVRIHKVIDGDYKPLRYKVEKGIIYAIPKLKMDSSGTISSGNLYLGNGSDNTFSITFSFSTAADIAVTLDNTPQTIVTHYNIVGSSVVFTSPPPAGVVIQISNKVSSSSDSPSILLVYVDNTTPEHLFDPTFKKALAAQLAADMCYKITQSTTLMSGLVALAKDYVAEARSMDSMEGEAQDINFSYFDDSRRTTHEIYPKSDFF